MSLSHGILGFLSYGDMTGYDLAKAFNSSVKFFWYAQNSHIYLELNKLEKQGYITHEQIIQTDKPNKKLYSITPAGKEEFLNWIAYDSNDINKNKDAFLLKIFFAGNKSPEQTIEILKQFLQDSIDYANSMSTIPENIKNYGENLDPYQVMYWEFTADFGRRHIQLCIDWANDCIKKLEKLL